MIALCTRTGDANTIAQDYGVTREALCNLKNNLLGEGESITMPKEEDPPPMTVDTLLSEIETSSSRSAG